jgi:hypothetical protein
LSTPRSTGIKPRCPDDERYDEISTGVRDMIAFNIEFIPDVHCAGPSPGAPWATTRCALSMAQTDEVKRNLERLQPVGEKYGY